MRSSVSNVRKLILAGILTAFALALSLVDTSISSLLAFIPGFKLGLANAVSIFALYYLGMPWACLIGAARCLLTAFFSGQVTMLLFSLLGAFGSLLMMWLLRWRVSLIKVSVSGGVTHNLMQLLAAGLVTATPSIVSYMPVLILLGTATGLCLGVLCELVFGRLPMQMLPERKRRTSLKNERAGRMASRNA